MALRNWLRSAKNSQKLAKRSKTRLGVQHLEARDVPAADFLSAFGLSSDVGASQARDVAVDAAGNSYLTGYFMETTDFDPAHTHPGDADVLTPRGSMDAFVAKYAPDDTLVWVTRMGGEEPTATNYVTDVGEKLAIDGAGNVYVSGRFRDTADFGSITLTSAGDWDGFVAKLGANGAIQWARGWGSPTSEVGSGVGVDAAGNVYALGLRVGPSNGTTVNPANGHDVLKFTSAGVPVWTQSVATQWMNSSGDLAVDAAGNTFVAGTFYGTVDFDPGSKTNAVASGVTYSGFVLKLTAAGKLGWVNSFVSQRVNATSYGFSQAGAITLDGGGNVFVAGYYGSQVDFNSGTGTTTLPTAGGGYIAKLTAAGSFVWVRGLVKDATATSASVFVYGLAVDAAGSVYATGTFSGTADFDPGAGTYIRRSVRNAADTFDSQDIFAVKLTAAGNFAWAETFGAADSDAGWGVAVDAAGIVHLTGSYKGTVDFDSDPLDTHNLTTGRGNLYHVKLTQN